MKNIISYICCAAFLLCSGLSHAQDLRKLNKNSYYTYIYQVPADSVLRMHGDDKYTYGQGMANFPLIDSFITKAGYKKSLPIGHYLMVDVEDRMVNYRYKLQTNLHAFILPGYKRNKLIVRDNEGKDITDAHVIYRKVKRRYSRHIGGYPLPFSNEDGRLLTIAARGEKIFYDYATDDKDEDTPTRPGPKQEKSDSGKKDKNKKSEPDTKINGYIVFNKPKYLPHDTVRCKAYLLHTGNKAYTEPLRLYAYSSYYRKNDTILMADSLLPLTPGAYAFEFVLSDSFRIDCGYSLSYVERKTDKRVCSEDFYVEDYLLNKYSYNFLVEKDGYYESISDTIRMTATCHDQVGMNAMDSRVRITALAGSVDEWYVPNECVPDTLFVIEKKLSATGDTKLNYPLSWLPNAKMRVSLEADFVNAASEHQTRSRSVTIDPGRHVIDIHQKQDSLCAEYYVHGMPAPAHGRVKISYYGDSQSGITKDISYPFSILADDLAEEYAFEVYDGDTLKATHSTDNDRAYLRWSRTDTSIILYPDWKHRYLYYTLYYNDGRIYREGGISNKKVEIADHTDHQYYTITQYLRRGEISSESSVITAPKQKLHVSLQQSTEVYPGRKDSVTIQVSDARGHSVANANVTAFSFTNQFGRGPNISALNGYHHSRDDEPEMRESELDMVDDVDMYRDLDRDTFWLRRAHLDTMPYYQLIYQHGKMTAKLTPIHYMMPQFAPFIFDHGRAVPIHMIYLDDILAYYDGTGPYTAYSIDDDWWGRKHKLALRTTNRLIHIDSIEFKEGFKTDLIMELDSVSSPRDTMPSEMTAAERNLMQNLFIFYKVQYARDTAWLWQPGGRVFAISPEQYNSSMNPVFVPIGPLDYSKVNFHIPQDYSLSFEAEHGYAYSFSPRLTRLELHDTFSAKHIKFKDGKGREPIRFGETRIKAPEPDAAPPHQPGQVQSQDLFSTGSLYGGYHNSGSATSEFDISLVSDSAIKYLRIYNTDMSSDDIYHCTRIMNQQELFPGVYDIVAITSSGYYYIKHGVVLEPHSVCHVTLNTGNFEPPFTIESLVDAANIDPDHIKDSSLLYIPWSDGQAIVGRVLNENGDGISKASITLFDSLNKPLGRNTITDIDGNYTLPGLPAGIYRLEFKDGVHLPGRFNKVVVKKGKATFLSMTLRKDHSRDNDHEVTVTAFNKPLIDAASVSVSEIVSSEVIENLSVQSAGVSRTLPDALAKIPGVTVNGAREEVQYIVNGHRQMGNTIPVPASSTYEVSPTSAINGNIESDLASKYSDASKLRSGFNDYAYWQPNLITDHKGEAKFSFKYPDNITSWRSYAIAMNTKHQIGIGSAFTRSFKDCTAELAVPQFLIPGDSTVAAIKITDYLHKPAHLKADFVWDGKKILENEVDLQDVLTDEVPLTLAADKQRKELKAAFNISNAAGFGDGEERSIPLIQRGTDETHGSFALLRGDTSLSIPIDTAAGLITVCAQSDILDVLIDEAEHVRKYPYWCMEQTASRLVMITMLEKIYATLGKPSDLEKEKLACITKLQKGQLYSGAYGWWEYSPASVRITTYVLSALAKAGIKDGPNIKEGYSYLNAALPRMNREEKLATLELYAETGHRPTEVIEYLHGIPFDSLSLHQRLQYIRSAMLASGADSSGHWQWIMAKKQQTIFGGSYWGEDSWSWYSNQISSTVMVYEIAGLKKDYALQEEIIQYFLEKRSHSGWRNTAESAKIVYAILPKVLVDRGVHPQINPKVDVVLSMPPSLTVSGIGEIRTFPFQAKLQPSAPSLDISKKGSAPVYFTAYQTVFNTAPKAVFKDFDVKTSFENGGESIKNLSAGESADLVVNIETHKYCEYLMIEVPIPAGCTYGNKQQAYGYSEVHREYFKDKVLIFCEAFQEGSQEFHIPLEARYRGSYTVNPVHVQLMYFPTFFGRNDIKRVSVK